MFESLELSFSFSRDQGLKAGLREGLQDALSLSPLLEVGDWGAVDWGWEVPAWQGMRQGPCPPETPC